MAHCLFPIWIALSSRYAFTPLSSRYAKKGLLILHSQCVLFADTIISIIIIIVVIVPMLFEGSISLETPFAQK